MQPTKLMVGFGYLAVCIILVFAGSRSAYACSPSGANEIGWDNGFVYATTSYSDCCGDDNAPFGYVDATVVLDSPSGRQSEVYSGLSYGSVAVSTSLAIGTDFGQYTNQGTAYDYYLQQAVTLTAVQINACVYPNNESSTYLSHSAPGSGYYSGVFSATLDSHGGTASYTNRTVTESLMNLVSSGQGACWDNASFYAQPSLGDFTASSWTVSGTAYGNDLIGWNTTQSDYYQSRLQSGQGCFVFQDKQNMTINGCSQNFASQLYDSHTNTFVIYNMPGCAGGTSTMCAYRSAASGVAK